MIANIHNENFGYSVACDGNWVAIGNPSLLPYESESFSFIRTGSVEVYRYNINTDSHDLKIRLHRPFNESEEILLTTELTGSPTSSVYTLHTELTGSVVYTSDLDILIDVGNYYHPREDGYGISMDMFNKILVVGDPYFSSSIIIGSSSYEFSGSGAVDFYDVSILDIDPYSTKTQPQIVGYDIVGSNLVVNVTVPASQSFGYVLLEASESGSEYKSINIGSTSNVGGSLSIATNYITTSADLSFRVSGIVLANPYLFSIKTPSMVTSSFGYHVSRNENWLAVSSIYESGSKGVVFMYQKLNNNETSWSLYQTIDAPSDIVDGDMFGWSVDLNKATGSFSCSLVIGSHKPSQSSAYVYEYISGSWTHKFTLKPDYSTVYPLTFFPSIPFFSGSTNTADSFGHDVAIYGNTIVVGAPTDRFIYEYVGSSLYHQGAVYFFERCTDPNKGYYLARKSYGNEKVIKDNRYGNSVSVFENYAVVGVPKWMLNSSNCFLRGSLYQKHYCGVTDNNVNGQFALYAKITGSIPDTSEVDWDLLNIYQSKKRFMQPHRSYGFSVDMDKNFIVIGSPMLMSGSHRVMDFAPGTASFTGSIYDIGDLSGKAYIYNLKNYRDKFYVGNVFYRNGKIVIMSSGSIFENVLQSNIEPDLAHLYDISLKSKQVIFEKQIVCSVEPGEFNVSTNPTAVIMSSSLYDLNNNGKFDFQDCDVLLRYMKYKSTELMSQPSTDWSSSLINTNTDEEESVYNMYYSMWEGTENLYSQSYSIINNSLYSELDFNEDNKIDDNDMNILWKYFIHRLTQKNYETYITPNSKRKYLSDIIGFLNSRTLLGVAPQIKPDFISYSELSKLDPTGSYLAPTVTSIGLYCGTELVAIAKLGSPIKITPDYPINFVVKMDY